MPNSHISYLANGGMYFKENLALKILKIKNVPPKVVF